MGEDRRVEPALGLQFQLSLIQDQFAEHVPGQQRIGQARMSQVFEILFPGQREGLVRLVARDIDL